MRSRLRWADLREANLEGASLYRANLSGANLDGVILNDVYLDADLTGCRICGVSAWGLKLSEGDAAAELDYYPRIRADAAQVSLLGAPPIQLPNCPV